MSLTSGKETVEIRGNNSITCLSSFLFLVFILILLVFVGNAQVYWSVLWYHTGLAVCQTHPGFICTYRLWNLNEKERPLGNFDAFEKSHSSLRDSIYLT